jgi:hypothetical protein
MTLAASITFQKAKSSLSGVRRRPRRGQGRERRQLLGRFIRMASRSPKLRGALRGGVTRTQLGLARNCNSASACAVSCALLLLGYGSVHVEAPEPRTIAGYLGEQRPIHMGNHVVCMIIQLFSDDQLRSRDIDSLKVLLRNKLGGYRVAIKYITTDNYVSRGVRCQERPNSIGCVSYPSPDKVIQDGRANRAGTSMFYCSAAAAAVFFELRAKTGDQIALSEWDVIEPLWMHNLGYHRAALQRIGATVHRLTDLIPDEPKENEQLRRRLSLAFTKDVRKGQEYKYKLSIAINELLFDKAEAIPKVTDGPSSNHAAGTIYPAMQMRGAADNLAIRPEFVDTSLRIKSVRHVLVEESSWRSHANPRSPRLRNPDQLRRGKR